MLYVVYKYVVICCAEYVRIYTSKKPSQLTGGYYVVMEEADD